MSSNPTARLYDRSSSSWEAPSWLSQFVRDEVRPILVRHEAAALAALERYHQRREQQFRDEAEFDDRQRRHVLAHATDPWNGLEPVNNGCLEMHRDTFIGESWPVFNRPPAGLTENDRPIVDDIPMPPPQNRDLESDECYAVLLAIHDEVRDPREQFGPTGLWYAAWRHRVRSLLESSLADLQRLVLAIASNERRLSPSQEPPPQTPDVIVPSPDETVPPKPKRKASKIDQAIGLLTKHSDWTDPQIAEEVGCSLPNLSGNKRYRIARDGVRRMNQAQLRRSTTNTGSDMNLYEDEQAAHDDE